MIEWRINFFPRNKASLEEGKLVIICENVFIINGYEFIVLKYLTPNSFISLIFWGELLSNEERVKCNSGERVMEVFWKQERFKEFIFK